MAKWQKENNTSSVRETPSMLNILFETSVFSDVKLVKITKIAKREVLRHFRIGKLMSTVLLFSKQNSKNFEKNMYCGFTNFLISTAINGTLSSELITLASSFRSQDSLGKVPMIFLRNHTSPV